MLRQIVIDGQIYVYELSRKRVKNINIRINHDGAINVSCPNRTTIGEVEAFMRAESAFIIRSLAKVSYRKDNAARPSTYVDGEQVNVFGERCTLHVNTGFPFKGLSFVYPDIYVNAATPEQAERIYQKWRRKLTFNYNLFEAPEELIAYVVVHELAHFLEANHSERFWAHVADIMPDYKIRRKALREY